MIRRFIPTTLSKQASRYLKSRSHRHFRPDVLGMEDRLLMAVVTVVQGQSIQTAINNAGNGDTINVGAGTYTEQLTIGKSITVTGAGAGSTILQAPSTLAYDTGVDPLRSLVTITSGATVDFGKFTVTGPKPTNANDPTNNTGTFIDAGFFVRDGAAATIHDDTITNITGNNDNIGYGILVGRVASTTVTGTATISNDIISNYQKGGIYIEGAGSSASIGGNQITGLSGDTLFAQNGIAVLSGAYATIGMIGTVSSPNTISGNEFSGSSGGPDFNNDTQATGIVLIGAADGTSVIGNTIDGNDIGIYSNTSGTVTINSNRLGTTTANRYEGIFLDQGTTALSSNTIIGGNIGVAAASFDGNTADTVGILNGNTISSTLAFEVANETSSGSPTVRFTAQGNNLGGSGDRTSSNSIVSIIGSVPVVDASDNYWGTVDPAIVQGRANGGNNVDYSPYQASPFDNSTLYVVATGSQVGTTGRVQEGINSAAPTSANPVPTVYVEPGRYTEQLLITKSLTVTGVEGRDNTTIQTPGNLASYGGTNNDQAQSIVTIAGSGVDVNFNGLTVAGPYTGPVPTNNLFGIFVRDSANATIRNDKVQDVRQNPLSGNQFGTAIQVGRVALNTIGTATIDQTIVTGYQKNGITVDGAGSNGTITATDVTGAGTTEVTAQNGIQISRGATGSVTGGSVVSNNYDGDLSKGTANGILLSGAGSGVSVSNVFMNGNYVAITSTGATGTTTLQGNTILGSILAGINTVSSGSASTTTIDNNTINSAGVANSDGIFGSGLGTTKITNNTIFATAVAVYTTFTDPSTKTTINGNTIDDSAIPNTNAYGIFNTSAGTTTIDNNTIRQGTVALYTQSTDNNGSTEVNGNHIVSNGAAGTYGIYNNSTGTSTINGNFVDATDVAIDSDSAGSTMINSNILGGTTANTTTGIEIDQGPVMVLNNIITGGITGISAIPVDGSISGMFNTNTVGGYSRTGILINGATSATISGNTITGIGMGATAGEFGIQVSGGTIGTVTGNTISNNATAATRNTNSVGILLSGSGNGSVVMSNILDNNDVGITAGTDANSETEIRQNLINTMSGSTGVYGIGNSSAGTSIINGNTIGNTMGSTALGIVSNASGMTTINKNTITSTSSSYTGIEVDQGTVTAQRNTINSNGARYGIIAVANSGDVTVNLQNTQVNGADTGILIDSTRANGQYNATVNITDTDPTLATTVTNSISHGATLAQTIAGHSTLHEAFDPRVMAGMATYTENSNGTYNVTLPFSGSDNITSANDLVFMYQVDGGMFMSATSPVTVNNLSQGTHTIVLQVMNQGTGAHSTATQSVTLMDGISDGGFEVPAMSAGQFMYRPTGTPWTFTGASGIASNNSAFTNGNPPAPEGTQVAFLQQGDGTTSGSSASYFSQMVTFQNTGMYTVSFQAAQRANFSQAGQNFMVLVDGTSVGRFQPTGTSYQGFTSTQFMIMSAGVHTITFVGVDSSGGDNTAFIDAIIATPVPTSTTFMPMVGDAGFEAPSLNGGFQYNPAVSNSNPWTFAGSSGVSTNGSGFTSGNPNAPEGSQVAFLQGGSGSTISQSVDFGTTGGTYVITFNAAQRGNIANQQQNFQVLVDGTVVGTFMPSSANYQALTTTSFMVGSGMHTISFQGLDSAGGDNTAFIDNVAIATASTKPTVADGGFATPSVGSGRFLYNPSTGNGNPWTFGGSSGVSGNGSGFTSGNPSAPDGDGQVAFLQGGSGSTISQSINFGTTGTYNLNFQSAQRGNDSSKQDFLVQILDANGTVVATKTFKPGSTSYEMDSMSFTIATAGVYTIQFVGVDTATGDNTAFIDGVTLS